MINRISKLWVSGLAMLLLTPGAGALDLVDYQWHNRVLVLVAASPENPSVAAMALNRIEQSSSALTERHVVVIQLYTQANSLADGRPLTAAEAEGLRKELAVDRHDEALILIGKDGDIKRRAPLQIELAEIFAQIDAMPMRREEMRRQRSTAPDEFLQRY